VFLQLDLLGRSLQQVMYAGTQAIQTRGRARRGTSGLPISRSQLPGLP